jgi:hypothetical protein
MEVKQALKDHRFRNTLPKNLAKEVNDFLNNPGCPCNVPLYRSILKDCKKQLQEYFPGKEIANVEKEIQTLAQNTWSVINCSVDKLEENLRKLPPGRKQLAITRYEDKVTVVVNELDIVY